MSNEQCSEGGRSVGQTFILVFFADFHREYLIESTPVGIARSLGQKSRSGRSFKPPGRNPLHAVRVQGEGSVRGSTAAGRPPVAGYPSPGGNLPVAPRCKLSSLSCPLLSCPVLSCPLLSIVVLRCAALRCAVLRCAVPCRPALSCVVLRRVAPCCAALSCVVLCCPAVLCCPVLSCVALSEAVLSWLVLSCPCSGPIRVEWAPAAWPCRWRGRKTKASVSNFFSSILYNI